MKRLLFSTKLTTYTNRETSPQPLASDSPTPVEPHTGKLMLSHSEQFEIHLQSCQQLRAMLNSARSVSDKLNAFCKCIEDYSDQRMLVSVLLYDPQTNRLNIGAAPSLPDNYNRAIDGLRVGENSGSCGTAAFCRHPIYVVDIATDPLWNDFRDFALPFGLRACWSVPIISGDTLLGTLAMYYDQIRSPNSTERETIKLAAKHVAQLICAPVVGH